MQPSSLFVGPMIHLLRRMVRNSETNYAALFAESLWQDRIMLPQDTATPPQGELCPSA